jgi:hypothetical protein
MIDPVFPIKDHDRTGLSTILPQTGIFPLPAVLLKASRFSGVHYGQGNA